MDDQVRTDERTDALEARIGDLEQRLRSSGSGSGGRREGIETAFWAVMREVFPQETRHHMKAAGREQLLAARSYLDHWIAKLDEGREETPAAREQISIE